MRPPQWPDLNQTASTKPGAIQSDSEAMPEYVLASLKGGKKERFE
jgi:hypothetical protein